LLWLQQMNVLNPNFRREVDGINGLALVVVQHCRTREVLMVAFTDQAGFEQTLATGNVSLYSTSRKESWVKGQESGNFMKVAPDGILIDCDGDTLVYLVDPQGQGVACHTGAESCFYRKVLRPGLLIMPAPKSGAHQALQWTDLQVQEELAAEA
jgi:phosphoribosyl-AMP cyclohydrolase